MLLVLMRHGIAEDGAPDEARKLTAEGREKVARVAALLGQFNVRPGLVVASHRVRAQETAQIVIDTLSLKTKWVQSGAVDFYSSWEESAADLNKRIAAAGAETVLVAGHMPHISVMASMCLLGQDAEFNFRKAAAMAFRFDGLLEAGAGNLHFYLTPSVAKSG